MAAKTLVKVLLVSVAVVLTGFTALVTVVLPQKPVADAGADRTVDVGEGFSFDGLGSTGTGLVYTWYTADGNPTLVGPSPSYSYPTQGVYQVSLVLRDSAGQYDLDTVDITVRNEIPAASAGADVTALEDDPVAFSGSATDPDDDPASLTYSWDFGDGTPAAAGVGLTSVSHAYPRAGSYPASLTVTDDQGMFHRDYRLVTVTNGAPTAVMSVPLTAIEDGAVTFDATGSTDTASDEPGLHFGWDFGDGSKGAGEVTSHTYTKAGTYIVTLRAVDDNGASDTITQSIIIANAPPVAAPGPDGTIPEGGTYLFDGTGSSDTETDIPLLEYAWDLDGDGVADAPGSQPTRNYDDDATVPVSLTVTDDDAATGSDAMTVTVTNVAPTAAITEFESFPFTLVDVTLRLAGEKWHDATMTFRENGIDLYQVTVTRNPGDPKEQQVTVPGVQVTALSDYEAVVTYTPENDPVNGQPNGASPAWILLALEDGREYKFHHTFNAQHPETWNWTRDLSGIVKVRFRGNAFDPGSDGETLVWDFGEGVAQTTDYPELAAFPVRVLEEPTYVYVLPGTYAVTLSARDDDGGLGLSSVTVTNTPELVSVNDLAPEVVAWGALGGVEDESVPLSATASDARGEGTSVSWGFGDGMTGSGETAPHPFARAGIYQAIATATDAGGRASRDSVWVSVANIHPIAGARIPLSVQEDSSLDFVATTPADSPSDFPMVLYSWDFGDGNKGSTPTSTYVYTKSGTYTVLLRLRDDNGAFASLAAPVTVVDPAPTLDLGGDVDLDEDEVHAFSAGITDNPTDLPLLTTSWTLGDGSTRLGTAVNHRYVSQGTMAVTATVVDDSGSVASDSLSAGIQNPPPVITVPPVFAFYGSAKTFSYSASAHDTFSDTVSLLWSFDVGLPFGVSNTRTYTADGSHSSLVKARDQHGMDSTPAFVVGVILDIDGDQLRDIIEPALTTNPLSWDTDGDGLIDSHETNVLRNIQNVPGL